MSESLSSNQQVVQSLPKKKKGSIQFSPSVETASYSFYNEPSLGVSREAPQALSEPRQKKSKNITKKTYMNPENRPSFFQTEFERAVAQGSRLFNMNRAWRKPGENAAKFAEKIRYELEHPEKYVLSPKEEKMKQEYIDFYEDTKQKYLEKLQKYEEEYELQKKQIHYLHRQKQKQLEQDYLQFQQSAKDKYIQQQYLLRKEQEESKKEESKKQESKNEGIPGASALAETAVETAAEEVAEAAAEGILVGAARRNRKTRKNRKMNRR